MPRIHYQPDGKDVDAAADETILHASLRSGVPHTSACGGNARCSTCRVLILEGLEHCQPRTEKEHAMAERLHFTPEVRLGCQTCVSGDVSVRRLAIDAEDIQLIKQEQANPAPTVGEEKRIAILFSDIRGFTTFSEKLPPYDVIHVLNRYFHAMGKVIEENGGCIDNYMGDGLMALFGLEKEEGAALNAVRASVGMLEALEQFKPYLKALYGMTFEMGVGIHLGDAVVGSIGTAKSKRTTAIGDAVNMASRIESSNKKAGTRILISEETYREVQSQTEVKGPISLKLPGKSGEYNLYEVVRMKGAT